MNRLALLPLAALLAAAAPGRTDDEEARPNVDELVHVRAFLTPPAGTERLEVGRPLALRVEVTAEAAAFDASGLPAPLLQLDVPDAVRLAGPVVTSHRELSRNGFVDAPWEVLLEGGSADVAFELTAEPAAGATIGLNVLLYARTKEGEHAFVRKRLELPLSADEPHAAALEVPATKSDWGANEELLQIGDRVADLALPRADGSEFALSHHLGERNLIVTTYRAHW